MVYNNDDDQETPSQLPPPEFPDYPFDSVITIHFNKDGEPVINVGDNNIFFVVSVLRSSADFLENFTPVPRIVDINGEEFSYGDVDEE